MTRGKLKNRLEITKAIKLIIECSVEDTSGLTGNIYAPIYYDKENAQSYRWTGLCDIVIELYYEDSITRSQFDDYLEWIKYQRSKELNDPMYKGTYWFIRFNNYFHYYGAYHMRLDFINRCLVKEERKHRRWKFLGLNTLLK